MTPPDRSAGVIFAILLLVGLVLPAAIPSQSPQGMAEWLPEASARRAERALSHRRMTAEGPPVVWLRFDDDSLRQLGKSGPVTPRGAIADLLERMRAAPADLPELVFVDIAIAEEGGDPAEEARLLRALESWNGDRRAPPLAIFAGRSCTPPGQLTQAGEDGDQTVWFDPRLYSKVASPGPDGRRDPALKTVWACPTFIGHLQTEYSCITTRPSASSGNRAFKAALPSPAWFAHSARSGSAAAGEERLGAADRICRGTEPRRSGLDRPYLSPVGLAYASAGGAEGLAGRTLAARGQPLLAILPVYRLLGRPDTEMTALRGAVVVIGAGNSWFPDIVRTGDGDVPGSILTAFALREARIFGLPEPLPRAAYALLISLGFTATAWFARKLLPRLRRSAMARVAPGYAPIPFLLLHEQTAIAVLFSFLFWAPGWLGLRLTLVVVVVALLTELMLIADIVREDWKRESVAA